MSLSVQSSQKKRKQRGFKIVYEAFADRNYNDDLSLVSRQNESAVLSDVNKIILHISQIKNEGLVTTISGKKIPMKADTFCVHSDTQNAAEIVEKIYKKFNH